MHIPDLTLLVTHHFQAHADRYHLQAPGVQARYVLNWGGFVNHSFTITDGARAYHLKLAEDPECREALKRWAGMHRTLETRYRAPVVVDWIDLEEADCGGLLFEHIDGHTADFAATPGLLPDVMRLLERLHADRELASVLPPAPAKRCIDCFLETYITRFDEDLDIVEPARPAFVSADTLRWMREETRRLEDHVRRSEAFAGPADAPTHGDLWPNNILVTAGSDWYVLDWDDLGIGDPAADYALLFWSIARIPDQFAWADYGVPVTDAAFQARLEIYRRTMLLDTVIDVLADYVECDVAPEHAPRVRTQKRREHLEALRLYRARYRRTPAKP